MAGIDEQALLDAQARLALAVAALDGAADALVEAGLEPDDCEPIGRSRAALDEMQRFLPRASIAVRRPCSDRWRSPISSSRRAEAAALAAQADGRPDVDSARPCSSATAGSGISRPTPASD